MDNQGPLARAYRDWSGRGWFWRTISIVLLAAAIGMELRRMMAQYPPWVSNTAAAAAAVLAWAVLTYIVSFIRIQATASANARIRELEEDRPRLSACLVDQGHSLFLSISNAGAPAKVWASMTVAGDTSRRESDAFVTWKDLPGGRYIERIATGETRKLVIAEMQSAGPYDILYHWCVPFIFGRERESSHSSTGSVPLFTPAPESNREPHLSRQKVTLKVFSDKTSLLPAIQCDITLVGCNRWESLSGVSVCPATENALQEQWYSFYVVAGDTLARLNALRGDGEPSDEFWLAFKRTVQRALSLAENLKEPYRSHGRGPLHTFNSAPKSSFGPCFVVAPDFLNWLLRTNEHIRTHGWDAPPPEE
jgi:hypothetical protein